MKLMFKNNESFVLKFTSIKIVLHFIKNTNTQASLLLLLFHKNVL